MSWIRFDDNFPEHPKVLKAGPAAAWLHVRAIAYCNRFLTDGFVPMEAVRQMHGTRGAKTLVAVGMWATSEGGYAIHDYLHFQPSKETVTRDREAARIRQHSARSSSEVRPKFEVGSGEPNLPRPVPSQPVPKPTYEVPPAARVPSVKDEQRAAVKTARGVWTEERARHLKRSGPAYSRFTDPKAVNTLGVAVKRALAAGSTFAEIEDGIRRAAANPNANPYYADVWAREAAGRREDEAQRERAMNARGRELASGPRSLADILGQADAMRKAGL